MKITEGKMEESLMRFVRYGAQKQAYLQLTFYIIWEIHKSLHSGELGGGGIGVGGGSATWLRSAQICTAPPEWAMDVGKACAC